MFGLPGSISTGADGSFTIEGVGRERLLDVAFIGENVAYQSATIVTREMERTKRLISDSPFKVFDPVFGATVAFTAGPARIVEGIVRDSKSAELLAGVVVESDTLAGYPLSGFAVIRTTTDSAGRFRLLGMPRGIGNRVTAVPASDQPYLVRRFDVPDPLEPLPAPMFNSIDDVFTGRDRDDGTLLNSALAELEQWKGTRDGYSS